MAEKLKRLWTQHREIITYVFFGGCTTLVNWGGYWLLAHPLGLDETLSTVLANVLSILFAYVTNRRWVFESQVHGIGPVLREMGSFFASRLATLMLDALIMEIFAKRLGLNDMLVKLAANIVIIVLNYVLSKVLIFKKKRES